MKIRLLRDVGKDGAKRGLKEGAVLDVYDGAGSENVREPGEVWVQVPRVPAGGWRTLYTQIPPRDFEVVSDDASPTSSPAPVRLNLGDNLSISFD